MMEEEIINVEYKDKKTGSVINTKKIRNNIFIDTSKKTSRIKKFYLKRIEWLINKIIKHADTIMEHRTRFNRIHKVVKQHIIHKGLRVCERIIGKHMIKSIDDIPAEPWNNHQRIWLDSWFKSIDDMWGLHIYKQNISHPDPKVREERLKQFPFKEDFVNHMNKLNTQSHSGRRLMGSLYITEVMEDTADRTTSDCFIMRVAHSMMELYGVKPEERDKVPRPGDYPVYLSNTEKNKNFFISLCNLPTWYPTDSKEMKIKDLELDNKRLQLEIEKLKNKKDNDIKVIKGDSHIIIDGGKK